MAGWSERLDGSGVEGSFDSALKVQKPEPCFDFDRETKNDSKLKCLFNELLEVLLKEVFGISCFRPLPPLIGEGQEVDLFKLHIIVRKRGGYCSVLENSSWGSVAVDCGFDLRLGPALKLVYVKYLDTLDTWLRKMIEDKEEKKSEFRVRDLGSRVFPMGLESDLKVFLSGTPDKTKKENVFVELKNNELGGIHEDKLFVELNVDTKSADGKLMNENGGGNVSVSGKQCVDEGVNDGEDAVSRKRKRTCNLGLLNWIKKVAKDPCSPAVGSLPERYKWKNYGNEMPWKQGLLVRETMLLKGNPDASSQQSVWQKKQKMHPTMYEDQSTSEAQRCSQRLLFAKDTSRNKAREQVGPDSSPSGSQSEDLAENQSTADSVNLWGNRKKRIPVGAHFQVHVPEFSKTAYESDTKWLGTRVWPLDKGEQVRSLIERDPIGKGRQESCGCQFPGASECVRFHIREKKMKVKLELGPAFYKWKFDGMGEEIALSWTKEDEKKFENIVKSNRLSSEKYFWDELFKNFPKKGREALVSYYFNVFLLRRRSEQNRNSPSGIDSDDDESEFGPIGNRFGQKVAISPGSIFCSPKKSHANGR